MSSSLFHPTKKKKKKKQQKKKQQRLKLRRLIPTLRKRLLWRSRIADALECPDNPFIPRTDRAGRIESGWQWMHNDLQVEVDGYYDTNVTRLLAYNRGVHEPQEERAFAQVIAALPEDGVMLELGAYWSFYSMWFKQGQPQRSIFLVEPDAQNLEVGLTNLRQNQIVASQSLVAFIGETEKQDETGDLFVTVDGLAAQFNIPHLHLLHCDIQGFEGEMLRGARSCLERQAVDYIFISTHHEQVERECLDELNRSGYRVLVSIPRDLSYSHDGLIIACSPAVVSPPVLEVSKKPEKLTLWRRWKRACLLRQASHRAAA